MMKGLTKLLLTCLILLMMTWLVSRTYKQNQPTEPALKAVIKTEQLPKHVAVMMDGNGRWAEKQGKPRVFGHQNALQSVRALIEGCIELKIPYLTLYAFSTENWGRPESEVNVLMNIFSETLNNELSNFVAQDIKLTAIGEIDRLPKACQTTLKQAIATTQNNKGLHLIIALSYSGRWDITQAAQAMARDLAANRIQPKDIDAACFQGYLSTHDIPDPDILIRTGGDMRISNFLLWQLAYTELFIIPTYWPDFRKQHLYEVLIAYQQRSRRFGKIHA